MSIAHFINFIILNYEIPWENQVAVGPLRSAHLDLCHWEIFTWSYLAPAKWVVPFALSVGFLQVGFYKEN